MTTRSRGGTRSLDLDEAIQVLVEAAEAESQPLKALGAYHEKARIAVVRRALVRVSGNVNRTAREELRCQPSAANHLINVQYPDLGRLATELREAAEKKT